MRKRPGSSSTDARLQKLPAKRFLPGEEGGRAEAQRDSSLERKKLKVVRAHGRSGNAASLARSRRQGIFISTGRIGVPPLLRSAVSCVSCLVSCCALLRSVVCVVSVVSHHMRVIAIPFMAL